MQTWPNRWSSRVASASFPSVTRSSYLAPSFEFDALRPAGSLSLSLFLSLVIQNSNMYLISLRIQFSMLKFLFCLESLEAMIVVFVWLLRKFGKGWIINISSFSLCWLGTWGNRDSSCAKLSLIQLIGLEVNFLWYEIFKFFSSFSFSLVLSETKRTFVVFLFYSKLCRWVILRLVAWK